MNRQDIREEIWQYLRNSARSDRKVVQFYELINHFRRTDENWDADKAAMQILYEEVHSLVTAGILFPGVAGGLDATGQVFTISFFGEQCLEAGNTLPFDPDGYVRGITQRIPNIDPVALVYLREAVACYGRFLLLSATTSLGAASEKCIDVLIDTFADAISDANAQAAFQRAVSGVGIYRAYKLFRDELEKRKKAVPAELLRDFEPMVDGVFNFIRLNRNAAGHPTGTAVDRTTLQANLQIFASYAEKVFALIDFLSKNKI